MRLHAHYSDEARLLQYGIVALHRVLGTVQLPTYGCALHDTHVMQCWIMTTAVKKHVYSNTYLSHSIEAWSLCHRQRFGNGLGLVRYSLAKMLPSLLKP